MAEKGNTAEQNKDLIYWKDQLIPEKGKKFTDPLFPPNKDSLLGLDSDGKPIDPIAYRNIPKNINSNDIIFSRASEIFGDKKYKLFSGIIEIDDVIQGIISDCYFLSSLTNLCKFPELILNLFKTKDINHEGCYEIYFFIDGIKQIVIIDDYLPIFKKTKKPCFAQPIRNGIWVMLLEKAWAKINGGYANIIKGLPCEAFEFLTGMGSLSYDTSNKKGDDLDEYKYQIL
jgi:calpain-15